MSANPGGPTKPLHDPMSPPNVTLPTSRCMIRLQRRQTWSGEPHETNLEADLGFDSLHAGNSHVLNIELRARNRARAACTWDVFRFCFSAIPISIASLSASSGKSRISANPARR